MCRMRLKSRIIGENNDDDENGNLDKTPNYDVLITNFSLILLPLPGSRRRERASSRFRKEDRSRANHCSLCSLRHGHNHHRHNIEDKTELFSFLIILLSNWKLFKFYLKIVGSGSWRVCRRVDQPEPRRARSEGRVSAGENK